MKRTMLALAVASLSLAAYAAPPPGGAGPPTPVDVNVIGTVMPFPYISNLHVSKETGHIQDSACFVIPDAFAYLRISGLHVSGNFSPAGAGPFRYNITLKRAEVSYGIYQEYVQTDDLIPSFPESIDRFAGDVFLDLWAIPGDELCADVSITSGLTIDKFINFNMTIMGEAW